MKSQRNSARFGNTTKTACLVLAAVFLAAVGFFWLKGLDSSPLEPQLAQASKQESADHSVTDGAKKQPRIATLQAFAADQLIAMGIEPVCVPGLRGLTPKAWGDIPTVQMDHSAGPNLEQLIAANPDIIITGRVYAQFMPHIETVTKAKVVYLDVESVDSVWEHIQMLGELANCPEAAASRCAEIRNSLRTINNTKPATPPRVLAVFGTPHSFYAVLPDTYLGDLVQHAGGTLGPTGLTSHPVYQGLAPLSMESVLEYAPDILLVLFHGPEDTSRAMFQNDPLWKSLPAVHEGRMHVLSDDLFAMRPGSRMEEAMAMICRHVQSTSTP